MTLMRNSVTEDTKKIIRWRSGGMCELCGAEPATNFHHRRARGMGGTRRQVHSPEWIMHLCGSGTTGCHGYIEAHPEISYAKGWKLRGTRPASTPVQVFAIGWVILTPDGNYEPHRWNPDG